ncbi:formylmethanofuran dehydrogenase subunit C [Ancylobacter sp. 6x-1]|uniref:Formylmethanofuran dehydrogenase subunit C n=1 Tax=Ancylobacter crimeensis TaxID=2579147 RepID=A0ABT0D8Q4_9HYPH|nr:formylmethanofuran dehydrogenase subunit C [Ancylobacter crimeensis]MCK0196294.1 formylmethanofuran dehydrogenase subunit C [Ancylobacter crimeensis]
MAGLHLKPRAPFATRADLTGITPSGLAGLSRAEIERLAVPHGAARLPLAELFFVESGPDGVLLIEIGDERLDHVGAGLEAGEIIVDGAVGAWAGQGMSGGVLRIAGSAGAFLGAEMSGGVIELAGHAGERAGGASSGSRRGMSGGLLAIRGNAGPFLAERQRGGLITVGGAAGEGLATDMIAGTVAVAGGAGPQLGRGMKRGTVLLHAAPELPAGFIDTGSHDMIALRLIARRVPELAGFLGGATHARRIVGDTLMGGQGEVLVV